MTVRRIVRDYIRLDVYMGFQKLVSDYISKNRNSSGFKFFLRDFFLRNFYLAPEKRFTDIFARRRDGRMKAYYEALRDAAIEFARRNSYGDAFRIASSLPPEYINGHLARIVKDITNEDGLGLTVSIETITACNLRCPLCFHGGALHYPPLNRVMPLEKFKIVWDKLRGRVNALGLGGQGEIFLHPQLYDILQYVYPTAVVMDTNGNAPMDVEKILDSSISKIVFSIDGIDQRTYEQYRVGGSFQKALDNLKALAEAKHRCANSKLQIVFKYIIFKHNEMYVEDARRLAKEIGADVFSLSSCAVPTLVDDFAAQVKKYVALGCNARHKVKFYDLGKKEHLLQDDSDSPFCSMASFAPYIRVDGTVTPCCMTFASHEKNWNIFEDDFESIWNDPYYRRFRRLVLEDKNKFSFCRGCTISAAPSWRALFEGTELAYPETPLPQGPLLAVDELRIDESQADELRAKGLISELIYYKNSGKYDGVC